MHVSRSGARDAGVEETDVIVCGDGPAGGAAALAAARSGARTRLIEVHGCLGGRCISGDFYAHASYRVTGNSVATGEAAGALAAVSVQERALPHEAPWPTVARALERLHVGPSG